MDNVSMKKAEQEITVTDFAFILIKGVFFRERAESTQSGAWKHVWCLRQR